jgi:hypothetical protein
LGFVPAADFSGASGECDPFAQDCPEGEKCVAYASSGGSLDANKCVLINGDAMPGESCMYGGVVEASDDCNASAWLAEAGQRVRGGGRQSVAHLRVSIPVLGATSHLLPAASVIATGL